MQIFRNENPDIKMAYVQSGENRLESQHLVKLLSTKKHVIWDWNGTVLNDVDHAIDTMNYLLDDHALPRLDKSRYQQIFDFPVRRYYDALAIDYQAESFESLCHRFIDRSMDGVRDVPLFAGVELSIRELARLVVVQFVLSATDQQNLERLVSHFQLDDVFNHVFGIKDKFAATNIERGSELIKASAIDRKLTVIVGDSLHDLEVGNALGVDVLLVDHGQQCTTRLKTAHYAVLEI